MARCNIGKLKFSLHMNEFRSEVSNFLFVFFVTKTAPTKANPNERKPLIINQLNFCQDKSAENISCRKKMKYFPRASFVYFMASANGCNSKRQLQRCQ